VTSENIDVRRHSWDEDRILFDTTGRQLILANSVHTRQIQWDLPTGQFQDSLPPDSAGTFVYTKGGEARFVCGPDRRLTYVPVNSDTGFQTLEIPADHTIQRPLGAWQSVDKKYLLVSFQSTATPQSNGSDSLAWLWELNSGYLANALPLRLDDMHPEIEFSRDCSRLFVQSNRSVQVVEVAGWKPLLSNAHIDPATTAWSHDGKWLALKSGIDTALYSLDSSASPSPQLIESPGLHGIRFEESGGGMALLLQRGHIAFLSIGEGQKAQFRDFSHPHEIDIRDFNYSPDGQWYTLAYNDGDVRIWSVHYNQPITGLMRHSSAVTSVAWSPSGDLLGTLTQDGLLTVWDVRPACATGQIFFHPTAGRLNTVQISPDGSRVAAGGTQGNPAIWNLTTGQLDCLPLLNGPALYDSAAVGSDAKAGASRAAVAASATALSLKETKRQQQDQAVELRRNPHAIAGFPNPEIQRLDWNDKGGLLAAICGDRKHVDGTANENLMLRVWETQHGLGLPVRSYPYRVHPGRISMPQFANDDRLLTHSSSHADLTGWQHGSAHVRFQTDSKGWLAFTRLSSDERFLAVARDAGIVSLFRVADGKLVAKFSLPAKQEIQDLTFNQSGTQLAVVGKFGLQVWDTTTGDALKQPEDGPFIRLQQVSFSPDDRHLATITENHVCQFYDTANWERSEMTFQLESRPILAKFNPDNKTFLTVTETGILQIWDWSRGELLTPPLRNVQSVQDADLSRDGTQLAVISPTAVRVWRLPQPDRRSVSQIAEWARDVTLTTVDVEESTLIPLLPKQFPDHAVGHFNEQESDSPFTTSAKTLWHVHQAKEAFLNLDEVAAEFHILRLSEIAPAHSELESLRQLKNRLPRW
jgi:WD40 repeat protein